MMISTVRESIRLMTYYELEELVNHIVEDLEGIVTNYGHGLDKVLSSDPSNRAWALDAITAMIDNIKQYPSDGDYKAAYRADSKWIPRDPIRDNKWLS